MPVGAEAETRTVIVKDVDAPEIRLPTEQVSVVVPKYGIDEDTYGGIGVEYICYNNAVGSSRRTIVRNIDCIGQLTTLDNRVGRSLIS